MENVTAQFGLHHIFKEPTHISNTLSSYVDLIFTTQPNLIPESGVQSSLNPNCYYQLLSSNNFSKIELTYCMSITLFTEDLALQEANTETCHQRI